MQKSLKRLLIAFATLIFSLPSLALSIGEVTLSSKLGQPLKAQIPLSELNDLQSDQIIVQHASLKTYDKLKIERPAAFQTIRFAITAPNDQGNITLSTREAVNEPYVRFLLHIRWPQGEMLKEVTLLLDPA